MPVELDDPGVKDKTEHSMRSSGEVESRRKQPRKQKRAAGDIDPPPDGRSSPSLSGQPTMQEMAEVLSPEDMDLYVRLWEAGKAYKRLRWAVDRGRQMTADEQAQYERDRELLTQSQQMERHVRDTLIRTGRARPEMEARLRSSRRRDSQRRKSKFAELKARWQELQARLDGDDDDDDHVIEHDELREYHELDAKIKERRQQIAQATQRHRLKKKEKKAAAATAAKENSSPALTEAESAHEAHGQTERGYATHEETENGPLQASKDSAVQRLRRFWQAASNAGRWLYGVRPGMGSGPVRHRPPRMRFFRAFR